MFWYVGEIWESVYRNVHLENSLFLEKYFRKETQRTLNDMMSAVDESLYHIGQAEKSNSELCFLVEKKNERIERLTFLLSEMLAENSSLRSKVWNLEKKLR